MERPGARPWAADICNIFGLLLARLGGPRMAGGGGAWSAGSLARQLPSASGAGWNWVGLLAGLLGEERARRLGLELVNYKGVWFSSGSLAARQVLPGRGISGACLLLEYKRLY